MDKSRIQQDQRRERDEEDGAGRGKIGPRSQEVSKFQIKSILLSLLLTYVTILHRRPKFGRQVDQNKRLRDQAAPCVSMVTASESLLRLVFGYVLLPGELS